MIPIKSLPNPQQFVLIYPNPVALTAYLRVAKDGTIYFTSCTNHTVARSPDGGFYDTMRSATLSAVRGSATGRLLRFDPKTRRTTELLGGLSYANGVALSEDEAWSRARSSMAFSLLNMLVIIDLLKIVVLVGTGPGVTSLILRIQSQRVRFVVRNAVQAVHLPMALLCP